MRRRAAIAAIKVARLAPEEDIMKVKGRAIRELAVISIVALVVFVPAALLFAHAQSKPAERGTSTLTVRIVGARNAKGKLGVTLFQDAQAFPEDLSKAIDPRDVDIDPRTLTAETVFENVRPGVYAVAVRHDENLNGELDRGFLGRPTEGYGVSNNARSMFRAPRFDEAKFTLNTPAHAVEIKLGY